MVSGGARNRSGPQPSVFSARSDARGLHFDELPSEGNSAGAPCDFPLPVLDIFVDEIVDGVCVRVFDGAATKKRRKQEIDLWSQVWFYPQAVAWLNAKWRWPAIAMWVRTYCIASSSDGKAADRASLHRYADQIGLTPAGLKENGWQVVRDEIAPRVSRKRVVDSASIAAVKPARRMRAVNGGA